MFTKKSKKRAKSLNEYESMYFQKRMKIWKKRLHHQGPIENSQMANKEDQKIICVGSPFLNFIKFSYYDGQVDKRAFVGAFLEKRSRIKMKTNYR